MAGEDDANGGMVVQTTPILRKLSPELRNIIYGLVIIEEDPIDITTEQQPGFTQACHEIRSECLQMYYAANTFECKAMSEDSSDMDRLSNWLSLIGPINCHYLNSMRLVIGGTGAFIKDPTRDGDPLASLVSHMKQSGCEKIRIQILVDSALRPPDDELKFMEVVYGSPAGVDARLSDWRHTLEMISRGYCLALSIQCHADFKDQTSSESKQHNNCMEQVITWARRSCYFWQQKCVSILASADMNVYYSDPMKVERFCSMSNAVCKEHGAPPIFFTASLSTEGRKSSASSSG